jgi:general secretion pathway protein K
LINSYDKHAKLESPGRPHQRGIALLMVLWALMLLSAMVTEFCYSMRIEVKTAGNFKELIEARYISLSGMNRAIVGLMENDAARGIAPLPSDEEAETLSGENIRWRPNEEIQDIAFGKGYFAVTIGNESGKVNINKADEKLLRILFTRFQLEEKERDSIVDAILDWRDKDDLHRLNGAEKEYYESLPNPYSCKNDDFDSIEEMLLVKGITPDIFYGGLSKMVTIYNDKVTSKKPVAHNTPGKSSKKYDFNRININCAPMEILLSLPGMTEAVCQNIYEFRKKKDITLDSELLALMGNDIYGQIIPYISFQLLPYYTLLAEGTVKNSRTKYRLQATVKIGSKQKDVFRIVQWVDGASE